MTRARHVTPRQTAQRIERIRNVVTALLAGDLVREELTNVLQVSPSGARKFITELREAGVISFARYVDGTATAPGAPVFTLALTAEQARAYLAGLEANPPTRSIKPSKSAFSVASRDPSRRFHIMADDAPFSIRVNLTPPMRDPLVAAFFGAGGHEVRV